jgi:rhomboid protease GluP
MQIEVKPEDYEVLPPEDPNPAGEIWAKILEISDRYGGWKLIIGICLFVFFVVNLLFPEPYSVSLFGQRVPSTEEGKLILFGSNFYALIQYTGQYWRWVTAGFLHFGLIHLGFNLLGTYILGSFLQKVWTARRVFVVFLLSAIGGNVGTYAIVKGISAGASGGVFGLMGALLAFFIWNRKLDPNVRRYMLRQILVLLFLNIFIGIVLPNIDLAGHISGFVTGFALGRFLEIDFIKKERKNLWTALWCLSLILIAVTLTYAGIQYFQYITL